MNFTNKSFSEWLNVFFSISLMLILECCILRIYLPFILVVVVVFLLTQQILVLCCFRLISYVYMPSLCVFHFLYFYFVFDCIFFKLFILIQVIFKFNFSVGNNLFYYFHFECFSTNYKRRIKIHNQTIDKIWFYLAEPEFFFQEII